MKLAVIVMALVTGLSAQEQPKKVTAVDPDRVRLEVSLDPASIIVDVRMKFEYRSGHIEKAVNLPKRKELDRFIAATPKHRPLYVYCQTETRARQAAELLNEAGFENVFIIEGGIQKWKAYNLPVVKRKSLPEQL